MRSMSGDIRFVRTYPLTSFEHVKNFKHTPPDKDVRLMSVSCASSCVCLVLVPQTSVGILYVSLDVPSTGVVEWST